MMDYEELLFGLKPIINAQSISDIPVQNVYLTSYLTVLDQLAVHLRAPTNRDVVRETGLLTQLLQVLEMILDVAFQSGSDNIPWLKLSSELIRCVANSMVENNSNRVLLIGDDLTKSNKLLDYHVGKILKIDYDDGLSDILDDLQMRTIVLVKNLCLENDEYTSRCAKFIYGPLLKLLRVKKSSFLKEEISDSVVLGLDLICEFMQFSYECVSFQELTFFIVLLETFATKAYFSNGEEEEEEESLNSEVLRDLVQITESIVSKNETFDFSISQSTSNLQRSLMNSLEVLHSKGQFQNKLIVMRRITSTIGYISANLTNTNKQDREMCFTLISDSSSSYTIAASLIVLSNSISSREDVNEILANLSLSKLINVCTNFKDPMQFQGFLDLFKKLLNINSCIDLDKEDLSKVFTMLKICHDQCRYYTELSTLVDATLNKLLAILPGTILLCAFEETTLSTIVLERGGISACLLLDKLSLKRESTNPTFFEKLWFSIFKFTDSTTMNQGVSIPFLFQLTKSLGVYLRNSEIGTPNKLFEYHASHLETLLSTILTLKENNDSGSQSVWNNGKFVAGMVLKLLDNQVLTPEEIELKGTAKGFFVP